jgi:WhiB family redox-sensing transcriptional regulator
MTERERRALLRRRPAASWRSVLETARDQGAKTASTPVSA